MGKESSGMMEATHEDPQKLEKEIGEIRDDLDREILELDRRRHAVTGASAKVLHNPGLQAGLVALAVGAAAGLVVFEVWSARRRRAPQARLRELGKGLGRALQHPEQIARPQPVLLNRILAAAAGAAASQLARRVVDKLAQGGAKTAGVLDAH